MLLESPLYEAHIEWLIELLWIRKSDQLIGRIIVCIMDGF